MAMHDNIILLILPIIAIFVGNVLAATNFSSDHLYSLVGRTFSYDTISTFDQNYTRPDKKYYVFPVTNEPLKNRVGRSENFFFY